ncbi:hypothetical protein C8J56DRAFT_1120371 [Mycena floridula]|nr:hypothetical protein C8J56DRAFT_1120371 [Mycena floridula]
MSTAMQIGLTGNSFGTVGGNVASNNVGQNYGNIIHHAPVTRQLKDLARHDAAYNSHEREREEAAVCAPKTRTKVLKQLDRWARGHGAPVCWLSGPAGAGKSTIAHTVAQQCDKNHCLAFSYFFSRRYPARSDLSAFIPTFVYTLAKSTGITSIEHQVDEALEINAGLFRQRLRDQLTTIAGIISPILSARSSACPIIVVIDVQILIDTMVKQLDFRILFASRPEADIAEMFKLVTRKRHMALQDFPAIKDVENYLLPEFHRIAERRNLGANWPSLGVVRTLAEKSEGIFAYASTLVRFIDDKYGDPQRNLETAKQMHKGLDSLYKQVLEDSKSYPNFELVIGAIALLRWPLPILTFSLLLPLKAVKDVHLALRGCLSVIIIPTSDEDIIRPYHTSLLDFLKDSNRHQEQFFKSTAVHQHILFSCISYIIHGVQDFNPFQLDYIRDYAFRSWVYHFNGTLTAYDQESIEGSELKAKVIKLLHILIPNISQWMRMVHISLTAPDRRTELKSDLELATKQSIHIIPEVTPLLEEIQIYVNIIEGSWTRQKQEGNPEQEGGQEDTPRQEVIGTSSIHMHQVSSWKKTLMYLLLGR